MRDRSTTEFRLLGPFEAYDRRQPLDVGTGKERALLALLLLNAGHVVSTDRMIDGLWGEHPPPSALNSVRVYVSRLRKTLDGEQLQTRGRGYLLAVNPDQLDVARFERLLAEGRQALDAGEAARAGTVLREALALWRGAALEDVASEPFAQAEVARLEELHLAALEERIEADLTLGRYAELVPELEVLVRADPLRERLWAQLMLALYGSGRQADALEAYQRARRKLVEELGLEPGRRLQELERAILSQDLRLEPPTPPPTPHSRRTRRRLFVVGVTAAILAALAAAAILATRRTSTVHALEVFPFDSVAVVDPRTDAAVAALEIGGTPAGVAVGEGAVWVGNSRDRTLIRIDPKTRKVVKRIGLTVRPSAIAVADGAVWVASAEAKAVLRVDPLYNEVTDRIDVSGDAVGNGEFPPPSQLAAGAGAIWVTHSSRPVSMCAALHCGDVVTRIGTRARAVVRRLRVDSVFGLAFGDAALWALSGPGRFGLRGALSRIDPQTSSVVWTTPMPAVGRLIAPIGMAYGEGAIWVIKYRIGTSDGALFEFDPSTGQLSTVRRIADNPWDVAVGEGVVWVLTQHGTLVRIDPTTSSVVRTIPLGTPPVVVYPNEIATGEGAVWVTMH